VGKRQFLRKRLERVRGAGRPFDPFPLGLGRILPGGQVTPESIQRIFAGSSLLQVEPVYEACARYLESHITVSNCLQVLQLTAMYGSEDLHRSVVGFVRQNFAEVVRNDAAAWQELPEELLSEVLGGGSVAATSQAELDVRGRLPPLPLGEGRGASRRLCP